MTPPADRPSAAEPARYAPLTRDSWARDMDAETARSRRIAWTIAGVAGAIAVVQAIALAALVPLKRVTPYTITVDRQTGQIQTTPGLSLPQLSESDAVRQAFLAQYVLARETFDLTDYQENYRRTLLWSDGQAAETYRADWDRDNPNGVQARYRASTIVRVIVTEVRLLSPETALIRFETEQTEGASASGLRQPWSASVRFSAAGRPLNAQDRLLNPLGFRIETYRRDAQSVAPVPVAIPPAPLPPAPPAPGPAAAATGAGGAPALTPEEAASMAAVPQPMEAPRE
jgi:type IV secretion system protein VirB8